MFLWGVFFLFLHIGLQLIFLIKNIITFNIALKSQHDILQVIVRKWLFINKNSVNLCEKE